MMNNNELTYWVALALMPRMWTRRKNELYVACYLHQPQYSIVDLFENLEIRKELGVTDEEETLFAIATAQLANIAFMVEDLLNQGYYILPITSSEYPSTLKKNLKQAAPCVVFAKGNIALLCASARAIVGSRNAEKISLDFTANVAKKAVADGKIVVSGFAKGVDRHALDCTLDAGGSSVIVLPQGITTFSSGYRQYYKPLSQGKLAIISTFHPKAPWSVELAMARNAIIYGMAEEIYAAQSDTKGGTWSGVMDGLRKGQKVFVRVPLVGENNANSQLIANGATGVDINGDILISQQPIYNDGGLFREDLAGEPDNVYSVRKSSSQEDTKEKILTLLNGRRMMSKELISTLDLGWSDSRMKKYLRSIPEVHEAKISGKIFFSLTNFKEHSLFD